ncbi:TMM68 protein, partial [Anseranas semipalmata]|nr:TMM68 protein [Anseranas semipalmata]
MIGGNESCTAGPIPMSYLTCLYHLLGDWTGVTRVEDYPGYEVYLSWLLLALALAFLLPAIYFITFLYPAVFLAYCYKRKKGLNEANSGDSCDGLRKILATMWDAHGRIWHGYELLGAENIPEGPALIVFYHGVLPTDYMYLMSRLILQKKRLCRVVADHFVSGIPGLKVLIEELEVIHGPREVCVNVLKEGCLLAVSPGGLREALFSDKTYVFVWGNRQGFAQVAIDAKVPIIPMFTQNVREIIRTVGGIKILRKLYEHVRLPVLPMYGAFPVKLRTFIGEPIPYDPNITAEELTAKTKAAIQALIDKHQKIPGNICRALMERFQTRQKED